LKSKLILIAFCLACSLARGESLQVVTENWPPFNYQNEQGQIIGEVTTNVKAILAYANIDYQLKLYPWARSYQAAKSSPNVLIYSIFRTPKREKFFHWFCPIANFDGLYLFKLRNSPLKITTIDDAKKYRIGVIREDIGHLQLLSLGFAEAENLYVTTSETININKLLLGEIDFILQSEKELIYRLKKTQHSYSEFELILRLTTVNEKFHCMALSISSSKKMINKLKLAFEQWKNENLATKH